MKLQFELDRELRENEILKIQDRGRPIQTGVVLPIRSDDKFNVYNIPLKFLIYNHLNDRFASQRREYELTTGKELSNSSNESMEIIEKFIWESNESKNKNTLKDLAKKGQIEYGIITRDGRIIDGNRRFCLLRKLFLDDGKFPDIDKNRFRHYKAIILPEDVSDDEMLLLETQIQMGEDEKLEYNSIEKYLKINKLYEKGYKYHDIANMMNKVKDKDEAQKMHETYKLMVDYLEFIEAPYRFSLITKNEDQFLSIRNTLNYYERGTYNTHWLPTKTDINTLKHTAYSYIREGKIIKHTSKPFRNIMGGQKARNGIFANKKIWDKFLEKHNNVVEHADKIQRHALKKNPDLSITQRENIWRNEVHNGLNYAIRRGKEATDNQRQKEKPHELIEGALDKVNSVDIDMLVENFNEKTDNQTYKLLTELENRIEEIKNRIIKDGYKKGR